jgi:hypothetical protein
MKRYVAALLVVLGLIGVVGVLAIEAGYAQNENAARAKCSEATLHGTYLFAFDGVDITGGDQVPFAAAGYDVFDGNGNIDSVVSLNRNGHVIRKFHASGTYKVEANCTGTSTFQGGALRYDLFIAPDGSKFTLIQVEPTQRVTSVLEQRATAQRVAP